MPRQLDSSSDTLPADTIVPLRERIPRLLEELPQGAGVDDQGRVYTPAQMDTLIRETIAGTDSLRPYTDSLPADTLSAFSDSLLVIPPFKSSLDGPVFGKQTDSMIYSARTRELFLYGKAEVDYTDLEINAEQIKMNFETDIVEAKGEYDKDPAERENPDAPLKYIRPIFKQGESSYELDSVRYHTVTNQALIWGARTQEGEGIISGGLVKRMPDEVIHMHGGQYTTCDADCPHFYLQMTRGTVVPGKKVVFGPAYMVIEDVPFYLLGVPFGFFPQQGSRSSGFILPSIGEESTRGFFLREGGYYYVFNDYLDMKLTGGIYTMGSWEANYATNYRVRYKYNGNLTFDYANDKFGEKGSSDYVDQNNMRLRWTHVQDSKFRPNSTFSASVNYATSSYNKYNATNMNDYLNTQISSSVAYSKSWAGKPFSFSMNAQHSQNTYDSTMSLSFPTAVFNVSRVYPFKRKKVLGRERWYEKIAFTYTANLQNSASKFKQSDFFKKEMFDQMRYGINHSIPVSASFTLFQYLNVTPNFNYTERWYFRKIEQDWNPVSEKVEYTDTTRGFHRVYNYSMGVSANTRVYGMFSVGKKKPWFIRHVMNPNVSFTYTPDFGKNRFGYWDQIQNDQYGGSTYYSPYTSEPYGVPGRGKSMSMGFSIGNTLEMKVPSDKDTTGYRKLKVIEALNISSSYNFVADSLKLSVFNVSLRTTVARGFSLNVNAVFDPYIVDPVTDRRVNKYVAAHGKGLARLTSTGFGFSYSFSSKTKAARVNTPAASNNSDNNTWQETEMAADQATNGFFNQTENQYLLAMQRAQMLASQYYDFNIPWNVSLNYSFSYSRPLTRITRSQTTSFSGSVTLTPKWAVEFGAGYDIIQKKLTPGTVMIRRDLHCFQATLSWVPIGFRQSWTFNIRAKSSVLQDLKYKKTNSFLDNYYGF